MISFYTKEETAKMVKKFIDCLSSNDNYFELSKKLNVNEKTIYKWRNGSIPSANNFLNLKALYENLN